MAQILMLTIMWSSLILAMSLDSNGWRGIKPLISSRADVERLLGHCPQGSNDYCVYNTETETILVVYSDGPCEKGWPFGYNVPLDTVIRIEVSPLAYVHISALDMKLDEYEKRVSKDGSLRYVKEEQGISIQVFEGKVGTVTYGATSPQNKLHCTAGLSTNGQGKATKIADPHERLLAYREAEASEELKILDRFAELLRSQPNTEGYIIVYAGERSFKNEAVRRLECQRAYLIKHQLISRERLTTIDGGYRENRDVELYLMPKSDPTLLPFPTVRPSRVKIIPDDTGSGNVLSLCSYLSKD